MHFMEGEMGDKVLDCLIKIRYVRGEALSAF